MRTPFIDSILSRAPYACHSNGAPFYDQADIASAREEYEALRSTAARVRNEAIDDAARVADAIANEAAMRAPLGLIEETESLARNIAAKIRALRATSETESNPEEKA